MIEFDVDMVYLLEDEELDEVILNDENGEHEPMRFVRERTCTLVENNADPDGVFDDALARWAEEEGVPVDSVRLINFTCSRCGELMDPDRDKFCPNCGARVVER